MWGTLSIFNSGLVEAAAAMMLTAAVSSITCKYEMHEGLDVTLYSLHQEVLKIQSAIDEARGRRITSQKLLEWLATLIEESYRGEYYLHTFKSRSSRPPIIASTEGTSSLLIDPTCHASKRQRTIRTGIMRTLLFGNDEHRELQEVLKMLKNIDLCAFLQMVNAQPERPMKRYLYMDHTWLIDRDMERDQVMKFLFEPSMAGENNVNILPIVGSEGVGKTTLALHCFYDPKVQNHFSLKIYIPWTNIAHNYHSTANTSPRIFQTILKQCNNSQINNYDENTLLAMLKQNLSSERFLLVIDLLMMDHVYCVDSKVWNALVGCLRCGKQGSKVIVTSNLSNYTKEKNVRDVGTMQPILLDGFSEDEYMLFFKEHAFGGADPEDFPELAKMGREIAKKMNGSIWGAKILGELLRDNLNAPFWSLFLRDGFRNSDFQNNKGLFPVINTICQLLPKLPKQARVLSLIWGEKSRALGECNEVKSYRELMVLGPKCWTHVIKEGEKARVQFLVVKHFNLYECNYFIAESIPADSLWVDFDDQ